DMEEFLAKAEQILHTSLLIFDSLGNLLISKKTRDILPMFVQEELIHGLYTGSLNGHFQIACGKNVYYFQMEIMDIPNGGTFSLLLLQTEESEAGTDLLPIQRISNILALEIKNTSALNQIRRQNEYRFITEWLHGKMGSAFQICVSAESFGLRLSENADYRIVIVDVCEKDAEDLFIPRELHIVRHILQQFSQIATFLIQDGSLFLILNVPETDDEEELHRMLLDLGGKLQHILGRGPFNFCISQPCKVQDMPFAYEIALNISHISRACGIEGPFITSDQLYELSILSLLPRNAVVKDFVDRLLGPLERYDQRHTSNLLDTLSVYLSCGNNTKMTAEQLHVHYNSVVYRLDRIRSLLHVDLSDSEVCFQLRLALKIRIVQASN
ncbi:MAG: helix-turn-helix domain-containing protein, partial [Lachnospiraceae bacterium]|nr:helix-turn-helix domain-containing protein [Lachnospiraceae bacterium]